MGKMQTSMVGFAVVGAALMLGGCAANAGAEVPTTTMTPEATPTVAEACSAEALAVTVEADPDGTPGVHYLVFENVGDSACELTGFPALGWRTSDGTLIGTMSESDAQSLAGTTVSIDAGGSAYAWTHVVDAAQSSGECAATAVPVVGLDVTVPGATRSVTVPLEATVCTDPSYLGEIQTGPFDTEMRPASKGY